MTSPTPAPEEWTEEECIQLIREFRARPILWDPKDPFFFKKLLKPESWEEIGKIINHNADSCKRKMVVLMSSFRREKAKIMHSLTDNSADGLSCGYKSTWFAFKEMAFLMDKDNERKRQLLGEDAESDEDTLSIKKVIMQHYIEPPSMKTVPRKRPSQSWSRKPKAFVEFREESSTPPPASVPQTNQHPPSPTPFVPPSTPIQTASERDEEIKSFISFIGNKMKKYSDETKNAVQQAICEIIFKADQHMYDNSGSQKYTIVDRENDPFKDRNFETSTIKTQILYSDSD